MNTDAMEPDNVDLLRKLSEDIDNLREQGISWGLDDVDIDRCILESVDTKETYDDKVEEVEKTGKTCRCRRVCLFFLASWLATFGVFAGVYLLATCVESTEGLISKTLAPYTHPVFRQVRLLGLPVSNYFGLSDYYDEPCLVDNPFFEDQRPHLEDCRYCRRLSQIKLLKKIDPETFSNEYLHQGTVLLTQDTRGNTVPFNQLQSTCSSNIAQIKRALNRVTSHHNRVNLIDGLLNNVTEDEILADPEFHVEWYSRRMGATQILRKLFPRPAFLPTEIEVDMDRMVFIDNSGAPNYPVDFQSFSGMDNVWYHQGWGSRTLKLSPIKDCLNRCNAVEVTLKAGQQLSFSYGFWTATSRPVTGHSDSGQSTAQSDISVALMAAFL